MPIYEYQCASCGHTFDRLQKISDEPLVNCPACNQDTLQKLVSAPAFQLKGTGWYETDFKGGSKKACDTTQSSSPSDSKADIKPTKSDD